MEEKKLSYQERLAMLKKEYAEERKAEREAKRNEAKAEERKATVDCCTQALEVLKGIAPAFNKELAPVVTRLQMFVDGKKYTRTVKGE